MREITKRRNKLDENPTTRLLWKNLEEYVPDLEPVVLLLVDVYLMKYPLPSRDEDDDLKDFSLGSRILSWFELV